MQVCKDGHIFRLGVCQIRPVDHLYRPVDHRLFNGFQPVLAAHDKLTERQHKVGFQGQRVFILGVIQVDVQRVHIVFAGRRQLHHLPMQPLHKGVILGFWITDIHIVRGAEEHAQNLGFTAHTFAASRCPQL